MFFQRINAAPLSGGSCFGKGKATSVSGAVVLLGNIFFNLLYAELTNLFNQGNFIASLMTSAVALSPLCLKISSLALWIAP